MSVRLPAVAGQFYPEDVTELRKLIGDSYRHPIGPGREPPVPDAHPNLRAVLCPHAGYIYSGPVAAHSYLAASSRGNISTVVIIGPNHHAVGSGVATSRADTWRTPLGELSVDMPLAKHLVSESGLVDFDDLAHRYEHSIEVQLPFIQQLFGDRIRILPITMAIQDRQTAQELGSALATILRERGALLIASSDFTHYEPHDQAGRKDKQLLEAIAALDTARQYTIMERLNITACGYGPIAAVVTAARLLGAKQGWLLKYATSGDTAGDRRSVVGYAAMAWE